MSQWQMGHETEPRMMMFSLIGLCSGSSPDHCLIGVNINILISTLTRLTNHQTCTNVLHNMSYLPYTQYLNFSFMVHSSTHYTCLYKGASITFRKITFLNCSTAESPGTGPLFSSLQSVTKPWTETFDKH